MLPTKCDLRGSPGASLVKNLSAMKETEKTCVQSLGWEDPLEEEVATHSSVLAWKIQWIRWNSMD